MDLDALCSVWKGEPAYLTIYPSYKTGQFINALDINSKFSTNKPTRYKIIKV